MLIETVRRTIASYGMLGRGDAVVVAISGGADSVALLHVLLSLRSEMAFSLLVAHLNHGIRGDEVAVDAEFVRDLASTLGLRAVIQTIDVPALAKERKLGIEEAAREARYGFLRRTAEDCGVSKIAVAHTADDQAETLLLNLIRGAGPDGLAGMRPVRGNIIRPLVEARRSEVEAYLNENGLTWRRDATNENTDYARNRVRHRLLPLLESEFNPRVRDALLSLSKLLSDENEFVVSAAHEVYQTALLSESADSVDLDASVLRAAPIGLRRRCVRMAIQHVKGDLRDVEYSQVERLVAAFESSAPVTYTLPSGAIYARTSGERLTVFRHTEVPVLHFTRELAVPGITEVRELGVTIEVKRVSPETRPSGPYEAVIDAEKVSGELSVRTWRAGDRIVPLGMTGHKKLQDMFTDRKVPRPARGLVPIIVDEEKIIWVAGLAVSGAVKLTDASRRALSIRCTASRGNSPVSGERTPS